MQINFKNYTVKLTGPNVYTNKWTTQLQSMLRTDAVELHVKFDTLVLSMFFTLIYHPNQKNPWQQKPDDNERCIAFLKDPQRVSQAIYVPKAWNKIDILQMYTLLINFLLAILKSKGNIWNNPK